MENTVNNLESLKNAINGLAMARNEVKSQGENAKSYGVTISSLVCEAFRHDDKEIISFLETESKNNSEAFKKAKSFVSKGRTVGKAFAEGKFTDANNDQSVTRLYDLLQEGKKKEEELNVKIKAANLEKYQALVRACEGDENQARSIMASGDILTEQAMIQQGLVLTQEDKAQQEQMEAMEALASDTTQIKAYLSGLVESNPELFNEIVAHIDNLIEQHAPAVKAA